MIPVVRKIILHLLLLLQVLLNTQKSPLVKVHTLKLLKRYKETAENKHNPRNSENFMHISRKSRELDAKNYDTARNQSRKCANHRQVEAGTLQLQNRSRPLLKGEVSAEMSSSTTRIAQERPEKDRRSKNRRPKSL